MSRQRHRNQLREWGKVLWFVTFFLCSIPEVLWAAPQGLMETPTPGSPQSGIGLIRGWVCSASRVDIQVIRGGSLRAVYGEAREDTRASCGDSNNGFSLQFNWSELGEGVHTVRALADGEEFARAAVTVGTLGRTFFLGAPQRDFSITNFPTNGQTTRLRWLESRQQFVLSNGGTPPAEGSSPRPDTLLEDPHPGSFQSGIGLIRGWVCSASRVEVEIEGRGKITAVYGQPRGDTQAACGDSNNGFSAQVNWNDLGDGNYTVQALADGVEFGRAAFSVVTLGLGSFPTGLKGEAVLADFPQAGRHTTVEWQESQQNFVVIAASPPGINEGLSGRQQAPITDGANEEAIAEVRNQVSSSGNWQRSMVQNSQTSASTVAAGDREQRSASTGNFFLCATSLSFEQGGQTFGAGNFRIVDVTGNEVC
jgi:hypothetical protein